MNIILKLAGLAVFALMLVPAAANAQTYYTYNGQNFTQSELIAHLQQIIAQLQAQLGAQGGATSGHGITLATTGVSDVSDDSAQLSGSITLSSGTSADVWFEYGTSQSFGDETETAHARSNSSYTFRSNIFDLDEDETYYFRAVAETSRGDEVHGATRSFTTDDDGRDDDDDDDDSDGDEPDVTTDDAEDVEDDRAELHGEVDMNDTDDGLVFFVYGQDEDLVEDIEDEYETYDDIDEDGDDLQKVDVDSSFDDDDTFSEEVTNLEEDAEYFFQICVEFENDDDDDEIICGGVEEFDTDDDDDDNGNDEEPEVTTESASNIEDDEAELVGEVDMNDFDDGLVFFVYGEDEDMVEDVEDEFDSYDDVDEDGDDLQKVQMDSSLDDSASYELSLTGLDEETEYFFQICVEYEDEDDDEALICGGVEDFETED